MKDRKNSPQTNGPSKDGKRWLKEATAELSAVLKDIERCTTQVEELSKLFDAAPTADRDAEIMQRASMLGLYAHSAERRAQDVRVAAGRMKGEELNG